MPISPPLQGLNRAFPSSVSPIDINDLSQPSLTSIPGVANTNMSAGGPPASPTPPDTDVALAVLQDRKQRQLSNELAAAQRPGVDGDVSGLRTLLSGNARDFAQTQAAMQLDPSQQANVAAMQQGFKAPQPVRTGPMSFGTAGPPTPSPSPGGSSTPTVLPPGTGTISPAQQANINPRMVSARAATSEENLKAAQATERLGQSAREYALGQQADRDAAAKARALQILETARNSQTRMDTPTGKDLENLQTELSGLQTEQANLNNPAKNQFPRSWFGGLIPGYLSPADRLAEIQKRMDQMPNMPGHPKPASPADAAFSQLRDLFSGASSTTTPSRLPPGIQSIENGFARPDPFVSGREWARHTDGRLFMNDVGKPSQFIPE